ncbi:hypothetical protein D9757_014709 [Collybiopsis confluens]|uniref:Uncharacterized protein n=1 Tax=Collybiopsis confluens TaxID=2823264 RepID=A0A8H5FRG3_9AGAR|nr:hypothetical protein D9757_014709 [Collybiopsis confluens]
MTQRIRNLSFTRPATPLPLFQLCIVCFIRLMDPIAFTQIFTYIDEFITFLHLTNDPSKTGFYSGLVESTFAVTQFLAIYQWSKLSSAYLAFDVFIFQQYSQTGLDEGQSYSSVHWA